MADLAAGMKLKEVMEKYDMPKGTASNLSPTSKRGRVKVSKIADLNQLHGVFLDQLSHQFAALRALLEVIQNDTPFAIEHGQELAILYGVLFDKTGKLTGAAMAGPGMDQPVRGDAGETPRALDDTPDPQDAT